MEKTSELTLEKILGECTGVYDVTKSLERLEEQRMVFVRAVEATEKYSRRARLVEFARGIFVGVAITFFGISIYWFVWGNYPFALGFLGPALAALFGVWGFRRSRFMDK